jgi:hypothetical protein
LLLAALTLVNTAEALGWFAWESGPPKKKPPPAPPMTKLRTTTGAGPKMALPACEAVTLQPPEAKKLSWFPDTVQDPDEVKRTGKVELAVACRVNGPGKL